MKTITEFVNKYEDYILNKEKLYHSKTKIKLKTLFVALALIIFTYFLGLVFDSLNNFAYLIIMSNLVVLISYFIYKILLVKQYNMACDVKYSFKVAAPVNILYVFIIMIVASVFLIFSMFYNYVSLIIVLLFIVLAILSISIYVTLHTLIKAIELPNVFRLILNGLFVGTLFFSLLMLFHINSIYLSFFIVSPVAFILIQLKQYLEKKFIFSIKRLIVIPAGISVIILSFFFTRGFTYTSFYRGEFTFDFIYDTIDDAIHEFDEGVTGDVLFYENYIVIVEDELIRFFDEDFLEVFTLNNVYSTVYIMNEKLYGNKVVDITSHNIELYEFSTNDFVSVGDYYAFNPEDRIYLEDNAFFAINGFVYMKTEYASNYHFIENEEIEDFTIAEQQKDYIVFRHLYPMLATPYSYREPVQGVSYDNIAYHNGHLAYNYTSAYVRHHEDKVDPDDGGKFVYLSTTEDYFSDKTEASPSILLPRLFKVTEFYFIDGYYYIAGYFEFSTHDYNYKVLVINENGEIEKELIYDGPTFAISEDYMVFGDEKLKVYPIDSKVVNTFWIINGYGLMFFTMSLASVFAIEKVKLNPTRIKEEKVI